MRFCMSPMSLPIAFVSRLCLCGWENSRYPAIFLCVRLALDASYLPRQVRRGVTLSFYANSCDCFGFVHYLPSVILAFRRDARASLVCICPSSVYVLRIEVSPIMAGFPCVTPAVSAENQVAFLLFGQPRECESSWGSSCHSVYL